MRFSFIMGGIVGAALTIYLTRNQNTPLHQKVEQVGDKMKNAMDTAGFLMKEVVLSSGANQTGQSSNMQSQTQSQTSSAMNDLSQIEALAKQDPEAKKEMDKILKDTH